jgi:NAD(P)-dependent dehydrogenase (short-subunit alcohol dehydrogenase family)
VRILFADPPRGIEQGASACVEPGFAIDAGVRRGWIESLICSKATRETSDSIGRASPSSQGWVGGKRDAPDREDPMAEARAQVALVTGAGKRIGRFITERLAAEGYAVALHSNRSRLDAEQVAASIVAGGGRAHVAVADLADVSVLPKLVEESAAALGPLTLLVNCASVFVADTAQTLELERWDLHFAVNVRAPLFLAQAFAAQVPQDGEGAIVNIIDQRVWKLNPQFFSYTLTKSALWTATRTLAQALAPRIRVNAVGPGPTLQNTYDGAEGLDKEAANVLLRRRAPPEDVAEAVLYLARARSVTGQMIAVDSGQHLGWETPDITAFYK